MRGRGPASAVRRRGARAAAALAAAVAAVACATPPPSSTPRSRVAQPPGTPPVSAAPAPPAGAAGVFAQMARLAQGNVLARLLGLQALERGDGHSEPVVELEVMRALTEAGRYAEALRYGDRNADPADPVDPATGDPLAPLAGYHADDAVAAVARLARQERVVMINEAHHLPQHRAFTLELLRELRRQGYTWFAAETLADDAGLQGRGYPTPASGAYINEPVYGDLVRTALRLGFHVVAYEHAGGIDERERGQAARLVAATLAVDPNARIVVHAGYDHVAMAVPPGNPPRMAMRFREMTGITPLTVDQVRMTEHSAAEYEDPLYRALDAGGRLTRATVFTAPGGRAWSADPARFAVTVFHPRTRLQDGRPRWLRMDGLRHAFRLPADLCPTRPCLVEARHAAESADAIPVDRIYLAQGEPTPALILPPGNFVITAETADGTLLRRITAHVTG